MFKLLYTTLAIALVVMGYMSLLEPDEQEAFIGNIASNVENVKEEVSHTVEEVQETLEEVKAFTKKAGELEGLLNARTKELQEVVDNH